MSTSRPSSPSAPRGLSRPVSPKHNLPTNIVDLVSGSLELVQAPNTTQGLATDTLSSALAKLAQLETAWRTNGSNIGYRTYSTFYSLAEIYAGPTLSVPITEGGPKAEPLRRVRRAWPAEIANRVVYDFNTLLTPKKLGFSRPCLAKARPFIESWLKGLTSWPVFTKEEVLALYSTPLEENSTVAKDTPRLAVDVAERYISQALVIPISLSIRKTPPKPGKTSSPIMREELSMARNMLNAFMKVVDQQIQTFSENESLDPALQSVAREQLNVAFTIYGEETTLKHLTQKATTPALNQFPVITPEVSASISLPERQTKCQEFNTRNRAGVVIGTGYLRTWVTPESFDETQSIAQRLQEDLNPLGVKVGDVRRVQLLSVGAFQAATYALGTTTDFQILVNVKDYPDLPFFVNPYSLRQRAYDHTRYQVAGLIKKAVMYAGGAWIVTLKWHDRVIGVMMETAGAMYDAVKEFTPENDLVRTEWRPVDPSTLMYLGNTVYCERNVSPVKEAEGLDYHSPYVNQKPVFEWLTNSLAVRWATEGIPEFAGQVVLGASVSSKLKAIEDYQKQLRVTQGEVENVHLNVVLPPAVGSVEVSS